MEWDITKVTKRKATLTKQKELKLMRVLDKPKKKARFKKTTEAVSDTTEPKV